MNEITELDKLMMTVFSSKYKIQNIDYKINDFNNTLLKNEPNRNQIKKIMTKKRIPNEFKNIKKIIIDSHTYQRWNERVGPYIKHYELIDLITNIVMNFPERIRIETQNKNFASIDDEIIFSYKIYDNVLFINTFYGRKSTNIVLNNVDNILDFNKNNDDKVNLKLEPEVLNKMQLPLMPSKYIRINFHKKENKGKKIMKVFLFNTKIDEEIIPFLYIYSYEEKNNGIYNEFIDNNEIIRYILKKDSINDLSHRKLEELLLILHYLKMDDLMLEYAKTKESRVTDNVYRILTT